MAAVRVRQHVNPLSQKYQTSIAPLDWSQIYTRPEQPLHLDLGCARGHFLLKMAQLRPEWNFLGIEIREPLVEQANQQRTELGLTNLCFLSGNANTSLRSLLGPNSLQAVTIQFPDPWFKRRHQKRRLVQPPLVVDLAACLRPGGRIFVQSDIQEVAAEICDRLREHPAFVPQGNDQGWITENPMPAPSDRERVTLEKGEPVYRALFMRA